MLFAVLIIMMMIYFWFWSQGWYWISVWCTVLISEIKIVFGF